MAEESEKQEQEKQETVLEAEVVEEEQSSEDESVEASEGEESENVEAIDSAKSEQEDFKAKFYYLAAEMDNMKKRLEREKENLVKYGNEKVLKGLLDVVDNLDRTVDAIANDEDEKVKNIYSGVEMVRKQFLDVLKANGLEKVEALGEVFDPNLHEAMAQQPAEGKQDQEIIQIFQHGYVLNGRLLRAAKVVIANNG